MDLRSQKKSSFMSQPQGASMVSLQRSLSRQSGSKVPSPVTGSHSHAPNSMHNNKKPAINIKLVCVGDGGCGKTSLLTRYVKGGFTEVYIPTVFDNEVIRTSMNGHEVDLALWDTAGQEEYDRLRALSYPETNVLLLCYSLDSPVSLDNIRDKWLPEVRLYCPGVPAILVGLKSDYRKIGGPEVLQWRDGKEVADSCGLSGFIECSALANYNVENVFKTALTAVFDDMTYNPAQSTADKLRPDDLATPLGESQTPETNSSPSAQIESRVSQPPRKKKFLQRLFHCVIA